ncbi:UDP-2,4-diacetamido-2,4,6-trideoxy-beta-L-altropyranose hydrolase [Lysinibacillus capsici]|uniref:UDP-2,4-diacetamido-2,4, 6-trideoxy-beta-L-altropyranose hydrolase n=1 Tax=Lysinibacillus capsici TaxID=2115968 RepID=UPI002E1A3F85|nr:UDP-2,4-diacetamido-2,4,6-trideoxy-beta-L-altropyranose hydrolase [Lysinibacillus capsici]
MIVFRVDGSVEIGAGHVMRCLTLAKELKKQGHDVRFISRKAIGDMIELVESEGFIVYSLEYVENGLWKYIEEKWEEDAKATINVLINTCVELLIVDHYSIDEKWENTLRSYVEKIMVIDDLANRKHSCDILLDQNYYLNFENRYTGLVNNNAKLLLGPKYALLREEFRTRFNKKSTTIDGNLKNILIFLGGADPTNETYRILKSIKPIVEQCNLYIKVVVGLQNPNIYIIKQFCEGHSDRFELLIQVNNIAELICESDLVIGAAGVASLERIYLVTPSIVISIAENQIQNAIDLESRKLLVYVGDKSQQYEKKLQKLLLSFINDTDKLTQISKQCSEHKRLWGHEESWINSLL